jgi:hypothetical protein
MKEFLEETYGLPLELSVSVACIDFPVDERFGKLSGKRGVSVYFDPEKNEIGTFGTNKIILAGYAREWAGSFLI